MSVWRKHTRMRVVAVICRECKHCVDDHFFTPAQSQYVPCEASGCGCRDYVGTTALDQFFHDAGRTFIRGAVLLELTILRFVELVLRRLVIWRKR